MTLEEVKRQAKEMITIKDNTARYREQVEQLESDIVQLEQEVAKTLDFDKDVELQAKKERLPNFKKRLAQAEKKEASQLRDRGMKLNVVLSRYQKEEMANASEIEEAYQVAKNSLLEAYKNVQKYDEKRQEKAREIATTADEAGYSEAMQGANLMTVNHDYDILTRAKTKINLTHESGAGNHQSVKDFFKEIADEVQ